MVLLLRSIKIGRQIERESIQSDVRFLYQYHY